MSAGNKYDSKNTGEAQEKSWKRRVLGSVFNRRNAATALSIGFLVDQFGYAGEYGGKLLRTNSITEPAAPVYEGLGWFMHEIAWKEGVLYYWNGGREIYQRHNP